MAIPLSFAINVNLSPQAQQLLNVLQNLPAAGAAPAQGGGGGGSGGGGGGIFKPLVFLGTIDKTLNLMFRESRVANTYLGAMGKVFGAAMDILLIPFIPVFNLILIGMTKLVQWLAESGYIERLTSVMERSLLMTESLIEWIGKLTDALTPGGKKGLGDLPGLLVGGATKGISAAWSDPAATLMLLAGSAVGVAVLRKIGAGILGTLGLGKVVSSLPKGIPGISRGSGTTVATSGRGGSVGRGLLAFAGSSLFNWGAGEAMDKLGVSKDRSEIYKSTLSSMVAAGLMFGSKAVPVAGSVTAINSLTTNEWFKKELLKDSALIPNIVEKPLEKAMLNMNVGGIKKLFGFGGKGKAEDNLTTMSQKQTSKESGTVVANSGNVINFTQIVNSNSGSIDSALAELATRTGYQISSRTAVAGTTPSVSNSIQALQTGVRATFGMR